jgi:hypothetical protein
MIGNYACVLYNEVPSGYVAALTSVGPVACAAGLCVQQSKPVDEPLRGDACGMPKDGRAWVTVLSDGRDVKVYRCLAK